MRARVCVPLHVEDDNVRGFFCLSVDWVCLLLLNERLSARLEHSSPAQNAMSGILGVKTVGSRCCGWLLTRLSTTSKGLHCVFGVRRAPCGRRGTTTGKQKTVILRETGRIVGFNLTASACVSLVTGRRRRPTSDDSDNYRLNEYDKFSRELCLCGNKSLARQRVF